VGNNIAAILEAALQQQGKQGVMLKRKLRSLI